MNSALEIKASDKEEALQKAQNKFKQQNSKDIDKDKIELELKETKKRFLGLGGKVRIYTATLNTEDTPAQKPEEDEIEEIQENINIDGEFEVKVAEDGIFVKVIPPQGNGKKVHYQYIKNKLEEKEIEEVDWQVIQEESNQPSGEWVKVAPRKPELDRDYDLRIYLSEDKLKAYMDFNPALGGEKITLNKLKQHLQDEEINYGVNEEKLGKIVEERDSKEKILIAEGKSPEPGEDAELIYHFEEQKEGVGTKREDGSIDFYNLNLITNVKKGDKLVTLKDSQPGIPGKSVTGEKIDPPPPEEKTLPSGKNVKAEDDHTLIAEIAGQVIKDGPKVNVFPVHEVSGDVDLSTGNIDFNGNVKVKGDVKEGFEVKAEGNIEVKGNISAAQIESKTGEVIVEKGFVGKEKGFIKAKNDVKVKFVENGKIKTEGSIIVSDAVMHSNLAAGEKIVVEKNKGLIVGGKCRAGYEIRANRVGSNFATKTVLETGVNPEIKTRLKEIKEELEKNDRNLLKAKRAIKLLKERKEGKNGLSPEKQKTMQQLQSTRQRLEEKIQKLKQEKKQLEDEIAELNQGKITVNEEINPGVKLNIGHSCLNKKNKSGASVFVESEGEVKRRKIE